MERDLVGLVPTRGGDGGSAPPAAVAAAMELIARTRGGAAADRIAARLGPGGDARAALTARAPRRGARASGELTGELCGLDEVGAAMSGVAGAVGGGGVAGDGWRVSNLTRHLTCEEEGSVPLFATADPFDRAHSVRIGGKLVPACVMRGRKGAGQRGGRAGRALAGSVPRVYPASSMTSRGVAHDSAFDATYLLQLELAGIPGVGVRERSVDGREGPRIEVDSRGDALVAREAALAAAESKLGAARSRSVWRAGAVKR